MNDDLMLKDDPRIPLYIENRRLKREIERLRAVLRRVERATHDDYIIEFVREALGT
jgi:hypothetical protein